MYNDEYLTAPVRRKRLRLVERDYSLKGPYFVTICAHEKKCIFGSVASNNVELTRVGLAVREAWLGLPGRFPTLAMDEFIVMPNHLHGLLAFVGAGFTPPGVGTMTASTSKQDRRPTLSDVVCAFKSLSVRMARLNGHDGTLWQRGYYEHVVRDGEDFRNVQTYIVENPTMWGPRMNHGKFGEGVQRL
jgi:REP element-mobilizing transposase RayT